MTRERKNTGDLGEALAARYLESRGMRILERKYTIRGGEIDLIAKDGAYTVFVEVKTRTNLQMGLPREYVTPAKQRRIKKTALFYLAAHDLDCPARFDVAEVYAEKPGDKNGVRIEYLEDAFQ